MKCPNCQYPKSCVSHTARIAKFRIPPELEPFSTGRHRHCVKCSHRWFTIEVEIDQVERLIYLKNKERFDQIRELTNG